METVNTEQPIEIRFSLTRLQRVANPFERLIFGIFGISIFILFVIMSIGMLVQSAPWPVLLFLIAKFGVFWLILGRNISSLFQSVFAKEYINTLVIEKQSISFGYNKPEWTIDRKLLMVGKGVFGTVLIRNPVGYAIVLQQNVIALEYLKELIERP